VKYESGVIGVGKYGVFFIASVIGGISQLVAAKWHR
jgi:hypothetical protein